MKKVRLFSFYTDKYTGARDKFVSQCRRLGLDYDVHHHWPEGEWWEMIRYKIKHIAMRGNIKDKPSLWVDIDADINHVGELPCLEGVDIMALPHPEKEGKYRRPWRVNTLLFNNTERVSEFMERLLDNCEGPDHPLYTDEYIFNLTCREMGSRINIAPLPATFGSFSFDNAKDPAISHNLTSNASKLNSKYPNAKNTKCHWARGPGPGNFGDILTPYMIGKETGRLPKYNYPSGHDVIMGAGSTIRLAEGCTVWGSGLMFERDRLHPANNVVAVRGPITRERIGIPGLPIGDPGLILPLFYDRPMEKKYCLGVVPHYVDFKAASAIFHGVDDVKVINILRSDIEEVVDEIRSCNMVISSSLHGMIAAEAYGIRYGRVTFGGKLDGDGAKFKDFLLSLPRSYRPGEEKPILFKSLSDIARVNFIDPSWGERLSMGLWRCAPFKLSNLLK